MRVLESMGLVRIRPGDGTHVTSKLDVALSVWRAVDPQNKGVLRDAFESRRIVEPEVAALAALRATAPEILRMEAILAEQAHQIEGGETGVESDTAFHTLLACSTKNRLLLKLNESIVDALRETRERSLSTPGRPVRSLAGHRTILNAIRARNPSRARNAMLRHLQQIEQNFVRTEPTMTKRSPDAQGRGTKRVA
jgi:GntR family transcriptional repressor for pyruvate dehydrogenase complex